MKKEKGQGTLSRASRTQIRGIWGECCPRLQNAIECNQSPRRDAVNIRSPALDLGYCKGEEAGGRLGLVFRPPGPLGQSSLCVSRGR